MLRRVLPLAAVAVVLAGCQTVLSTNRAVPGETVTVTPFYEGPEECAEGSTVDIFILPADEVPPEGTSLLGLGEQLATGTAGADGAFSIEITAPEERDDYAVWAECDFLGPNLGDPQGEPIRQRIALDPDQLVVHAPLVLSAVPDEVEPGEIVVISGPWCVSQLPDGELPTVEVTFDGETHTLEAAEAQPFGEVWELEVTAPTEAGTYPVTATCSYDDGEPEAEPAVAPAAIVSEDYVPTEVVVAAQPVPTTTTTTAPTTTTTTAPPAPAPRAVVAQPSYTG